MQDEVRIYNTIFARQSTYVLLLICEYEINVFILETSQHIFNHDDMKLVYILNRYFILTYVYVCVRVCLFVYDK